MDHEIWTKKLSEHPGFISKEIWINEFNPNEVTAIIYWNSIEEWKAIPGEELNEIIKEFDQAFGADDYKLVQEKHQQNRWYKVLEYR
ncbi:MAG: TIGR03792 family protein [Bacteroidota bacterium]